MGQALPFCVQCEDKRGCSTCAELHEWIVERLYAVPVVRCEDCKNRFTTHCPMRHEEQTYNEDDGYDWIDRDHTSDDGFCDQGELATDDNL